uniref:Non-SMC condensin II complex, subunit D3 n=1 Tax=Poecilia reticulata TaxID=8081 RepID=A0A3P9Q8W3_POERE
MHFLFLRGLRSDWVDAVWDLEFMERKPLDHIIEDEVCAGGEKSFRSLIHCLLEHGVWVILGENRVSVKSLVAVLSSFVLAARTKGANVQQRVCGLHAASVYLLLLGIPGSIANKVFHEVLLDTCLDLTFHCWPQDSGRKRKKDGLKSSQADSKRSKPQRRDSPEMEMEEEEEEDELHFSGQELTKIRNAIAVLVQSLLRLLQTFSLKDRPQMASNCTQIFTKLLYLEPVLRELTFALQSVPEMAFHGLKLLCSPRHGEQKEVGSKVFHRLLYVILMMSKGHSGKPALLVPNQAVLTTRDQAIHFVCHLVDELKELASPFLQILLKYFHHCLITRSWFCCYRNHGAQAVGMLTSQMADMDYACFIKWLFIFSGHSKMVHRLFSVDVVMVLLTQPERSSEECQDPELARFMSHKFLIQDLLFTRRTDESPTVQGHALSCLAQCLELPSLNVTRAVHTLFSATFFHICPGLVSVFTRRQSERQMSCCIFAPAKENLALLLRRVRDSKTNVRKAALQALVGLLKHGVIPTTWENLETLAERSRDPAVSVKKRALQCLGELLTAKPGCMEVQKAWLLGVVPAVVDSENSVQDKALEVLDQVLLSRVKPYSERRHMDNSERLTWNLLDLLCNECRNLGRYFSRAFTIWSKQNKFTPTFISNLISHTETEHAAGAWLLLSKVVPSVSTISCSKILEAWDNMVRSHDVDVTNCCHILSVVGDIAAHLNEDTKGRITGKMKNMVDFLLFHQAFLNQHCGELVSICETHLASVLLSENGAQNLNEDLMVRLLQTSPTPSERKLTIICQDQSSCQEELPASLPLSQFRENSLPTRIKAHGVITLGKLCLQHEELVQKYLPVFARELEVGTEVAVRNNIVVIMCDLCVRYTNIVDHYIPNISACLRDDEAVIREQTLIMLTNLLQEEFVKWKGSLFFRFMMALVDPVPAIARLCEYCLLHRLHKKNPEMFSQHFIECIFQFNSYNKHTLYNKFPQSEREKVLFSLKGAQHREKRFRIYRFLLEHFTDAQRFNTTIKINQTVLACFADEELPLDADGAEILSETFNVLSLKELKLQAFSAPAGGAGSEEPEEENMATMTKAVLQVVQKKVVSQVQKKAFIENTVPLIISLKNLLEQKRSPVLKDLMGYLKVRVTMQDYRNEVKEFFAGDEQLAAEVEFALKTAEKEREMEEQMENCSVTPGAQTPTAKVIEQRTNVTANSFIYSGLTSRRSPVKSCRSVLWLFFRAPGPRRWNVQSPLQQRKSSSRV